MTDVLGSTVALTDTAGTIQTQYTYEPFGATSTTGAPSDNAIDYTGRENDRTSLKYYRSRYYHPTRQRFISQDPLGFAGRDANLYAYVGNVPTAFRDPLGLWKPWYHEELTAEEALGCDLSFDAARRLAAANAEQDYFHPGSWYSDTDANHAMPGTNYQRIIDDAAQRALTEPDWNRALMILGRGLHTVQDQWAHDRRNPPGTVAEHKHPTAGRNPDIPSQNPYEWQRAREDTRAYIRDFMKGRGLKPRC